jgi:hypothetical protein
VTLQARRIRRRLLWHSKTVPWHWVQLRYGWSQPKRFALGPRAPWRYRYFRFHLTPIHIDRWASETEIGLCFGKRTLCVVIHK